MQDYKNCFIEFLFAKKILSFGDFILKSGRKSPYFFNMGVISKAQDITMLGKFYAAAIKDQSNFSFDLIFGPAYKGIPIVIATAIALAQEYKIDISYCFNRKEIKAHGEGGQIVGSPLAGDVLLLDDVISAGTAIGESSKLILKNKANLKAVFVALDRKEKGTGKTSALNEVANKYQCEIFSIITLHDVIKYLQMNSIHLNKLEIMQKYRKTYGVE